MADARETTLPLALMIGPEPPSPPRVFTLSEALDTFVDYVTLAYHEARNARHLVRSGHVPGERYKHLIALPRHRTDAWATIQSVRREAAQTKSAKAAELVFVRQFGVDLDGLLALYRNPNWLHARAYGGHQWVAIVELILELRHAIEIVDLDAISRTIEELQRARHNTGVLTDKLVGLDLTLHGG